MAIHIRRREFILTLGGAAATWPLAARAREPAMPVIGFLNSASPDGYRPMVTAFRQGLQESGYVEGQKRCDRIPLGGGRSDRQSGMATHLIHRQVTLGDRTS